MNTAISVDRPEVGRVTAERARHQWRSFTRHYVEMTLVMVVGMVLSVTLFMYTTNFLLGDITWRQALEAYPVQALLVVAFGMSAPMVPWMRHRGHSWIRSYEMAAAMALPVVPFVVLAITGAVRGAQCGLYCLASQVAMLLVMLVRREEYVHMTHVRGRMSDRLARFNRRVANPIVRTFAGRRWSPVAIVEHRGRSTGRLYRTPVIAFRTREGFLISLPYGADRDWVRNVLASGACVVEQGGREVHVTDPTVIPSASGAAELPRLVRAGLRIGRIKNVLQVAARKYQAPYGRAATCMPGTVSP